MKQLTDSERLEVAMALLTDERQVDEYAEHCAELEQGGIMLIGKEAEKTCEEILDKGCSGNLKWSAPFVKGYFLDVSCGKWTAFDNTTAEFWMECFNTETEAKEWCE